MLHREWFCAGRLSELGLGPASRQRLAVVDVAGESVLVTQDDDGAAAGVLQRLPAPRLPGRAGRPGRRAARSRAARRRCAAPTTPGPTTSPGGCCARRTPRTSTTSTRPSSGCTRSAPTTWGGFLFLHLDAGRRRRRCSTSLGAAPERVRRYPLDSLVVGRRLTYDVAANYKVIARELQRVLPLRRRAPRAGAGWCRRSAAAAPTWTGRRGIPHREGAWTFTASGTSDRAPFPGLDDDERVRHKGELLYPNLMLSLSADHVAAFTLWPTAPDRTRIVCDLLFAPDEVARDTFDPGDAADFWDTGEPAGLGDLRVGAARHVVARATPRAGSRRWRTPASTSGAGCCRGWSSRERATGRAGRRRGRRPRRAGQSATAWQLARRGVRRRRSRAVRARARRAARRTTRRGSCAAATTRPAYVRLAGEAYDDWARLEQASGETLVTVTGGVDLFPPGAAIPLADYVDSMRVERRAVRAARRRRRSPRGGPRCGCPRAPPGCTRRARRSCRPAARPRPWQRLARAAGARLHDRSPVTVDRRRGRRQRRRSSPAAPPTARCAPPASSSPPTPGPTTLLAHLGTSLPLTVTREQVTYFAPRRPGGVRARPAAGVDLDGRPVVLRLPDVRRGRQRCPGEGGAGLRRRRDRRPAAGRSSRTRAALDLLAGFAARAAPGLGAPVRTVTCLYTLTPDRDFVVGRAARPPVGAASVSARATASSSRRRSAGCWPTWRSDGATTSDISAFAAGPAGPRRGRPPGELVGVTRLRAQRRRVDAELGGRRLAHPGRRPGGG